MAEKVVQKKVNRKVKKRVRKTVAALFLISSITVAAIPVPEAAAATTAETGHSYEEEPKPTGGETGTDGYKKIEYSVLAEKKGSNGEIPIIPDVSGEDVKIYTSANNGFKFAYTDTQKGKGAVLLGHSGAGDVTDFVIPDTLEAYLLYAGNEGSNKGYAAANEDGKILFYQQVREVSASRTARVNSGVAVKPENWSEWDIKPSKYETSSTEELTPLASETVIQEEKEDASGNVISQDVYTQKVTFYTRRYRPCMQGEEDTWKDLVHYYFNEENLTEQQKQDGWATKADIIYFYSLPSLSNTSLQPKDITDSLLPQMTGNVEWVQGDDQNLFSLAGISHRWLTGVTPICISNQRVNDSGKAYTPSSSTYFFPSDLISHNVKSIQFPPTIFAIADGAFRDCSSIETVTFDGGSIGAIGQYAFADCTSLRTFTLPSNAGMTILANDLFLNCANLTEFTVPVSVDTVADEAFKGCRSLTKIDFTAHANHKVTEIGSRVFQDCVSLGNVEFPDALEEVGKENFKGCTSLESVILPLRNEITFSFSNFNGCTALKYIDVLNNSTTFYDLVDGNKDKRYHYNNYSVDDFIKDVGDEFYFIGSDENSAIYGVCKNNAIAFKYRNEDKFEKIIRDDYENGKYTEYTYQVNSKGELLGIGIGGTQAPETVVVEDQVGPYPVTSIGSEFSRDKERREQLKSITIPNTIENIGADAFKGCINLTEVIFNEPNNISTIGTDAFMTQGNNKLVFYGEIRAGSAPFEYAMNPEHNYNNAAQGEAYIEFCSGNPLENFDTDYPVNVHVKYNSDTKQREVVQVPLAEGASTDANKEYRDTIAEMLILTDATLAGKEITDSAVTSKVTEVIEKYDKHVNGEEGGAVPAEAIVKRAVESAYNIVLPTGIQSIQEGLFSNANEVLGDKKKTRDATPVKANEKIRSITMCDVEEVDPYAFYGCKNLKRVVMYSSGAGGGETIGDYAFGKCENITNEGGSSKVKSSLTEVVLPNTTKEIGIRPFDSDTQLTRVDFAGEYTGGNVGSSSKGDNFECADGILYGLSGGGRNSIVQCLEARGNKDSTVSVGEREVGPEELNGVETIYEGAFRNCESIRTVDLSNTRITEIPGYCFSNAKNMIRTDLPRSCVAVGEYAFAGTGLETLKVPVSNTSFANSAFYKDVDGSNTDVIRGVTVVTGEGSTAEKLVLGTSDYEGKWGWSVSTAEIPYLISFYDDDGTIILTRQVEPGKKVVPPTEEEMERFAAAHPGKYWSWSPSESVFSPATKDMSVTAVYTDIPVEEKTWTVKFVTDKYNLIKEQKVKDGEPSSVPYPTPSSEYGNYKFVEWGAIPEDASIRDMSVNKITGNVTFVAVYDRSSSGGGSGGGVSGNDGSGWTVFFVNDNSSVLSTQKVEHGQAATAPATPKSAYGDYKFLNWVAIPSDIVMSKITGNVTFMASYDRSQKSDGTPANNNNSNNNSSNKKDDDEGDYSVKVINGGGSGKYDEGDVVTIQAYDPQPGYEFEKWTSTYDDLTFSTETSLKSGFLMPKSNVVVTANYKYVGGETTNTTTTTPPKGTVTAAASSNTGSVRNATGSSNQSGGSSGNGNGNTVQVNRNGISDTSLASATVNGSTDNFVIKITEDGQATAAVAEALRNEYGSLENIRYFAMDISLFDETGATEITDTSGLSVTITLPIPDELRQYAGNNKVGAVTGGYQLEKLPPKFTTVNGTPCVTFTATHFSPYTVYVDTANLSDGAYDATPKTGDAIHPKWFLAVGLALISAVLFLKKDKKEDLKLA